MITCPIWSSSNGPWVPCDGAKCSLFLLYCCVIPVLNPFGGVQQCCALQRVSSKSNNKHDGIFVAAHKTGCVLNHLAHPQCSYDPGHLHSSEVDGEG